jgi:TetR/AcrR family transcriptional regulator
MPARQRRVRGSRDAEAARTAILSAAIAEFTAKGLSGARMDAIARAADVAKGLVFHHFGTKEGLWLAALAQIYRLLREGQDETALDALGPVEGMRRLITDTFRLFREHPEIVALMNEENLHRGRHLAAAPEIRALYNPLFGAIERLIGEGRRLGVFQAKADVTALYVALSGLGYFYCSNRWTLSAAFAGDLFVPERIHIYETLIVDMVLAYLQRGENLPAVRSGDAGQPDRRLRRSR